MGQLPCHIFGSSHPSAPGHLLEPYESVTVFICDPF
jgi:hypothetical protein